MNKDEALLLINENIRNLKAYHLEPEDVPVKLNQNENPFDWPDTVKQEIARFCIERPWNRYPPFVPDKLKQLVARYAKVSTESIIVGNGSNEMLLVLLLSLVNRSVKVIVCQPTFTVYKLLVDGLGAESLNVSLDNQLQFDIDAILQAVQGNRGAVLILCSPNNPTGSSLNEEDLIKILDNHSGFCILDQAYVEFGGFDAVPLLSRYPNLIITRTFSKAFAAAGLRLGYMAGSPEIIAEINKIKLPYNINFFSEYVASVLIENKSSMEDIIRGLIRERESLLIFLNNLPFDNVYPSAANFLLVRTTAKDKLFNFLKSKGILVRDVSGYPMLNNCLRISIGTPDENCHLKDALELFFRK